MSRYALALGPAPAGDVARLAADAERAGFDSLWSSEMFHDPFTPLSVAASATERIGLGTSIALAFVRSPWVTALTALDLDLLSNGRFVLGLGTGLKRFNERWHGVAYGKPTPHIKEVVQVVRQVTETAHLGEPIKFRGQFYNFDIQGWQRPIPPVRPRIPIYLAGVREGMIRTAAQVADGLLGHPIYSMDWVNGVVLPSVTRGLADAGRKRSSVKLCLALCCAIDPDVTAARRAAAATIAFYATVTTYEPLFTGFAEPVARIQAAARNGEQDAMIDAVTEEMIDVFAAAGPVDDVRRKAAHYQDFADTVILNPPDQLVDPAVTDAFRQRLVEAFSV
jgi:probable F420-dependent oxidoreductase